MENLTVGCKAYFDSFKGLIPGIVTHIKGPNGMASVSQTVIIRLSASRPGSGYKRGDLITSNGLHVIPRKSVHVRNGQHFIRAYTVGQ